MLSRITRNSHRPRASDRTMVDTFNDPGLPLSPTRKRTTSSREPMSMDNRPTSQATRNYSGLDLEEEISAPLEAELFFLTSLFIELIDQACSFFDQEHRK